MKAGVAELVDALVLGTSGESWGFESLRPHHSKSPEYDPVTWVGGENEFVRVAWGAFGRSQARLLAVAGVMTTMYGGGVIPLNGSISSRG